MGSKKSNAQSLESFGPATQSAVNSMNSNFGNSSAGTEADARKRKDAEDAAAEQQAQNVTGQEPGVWDTLKAMGGDAVAGAKDMASDPRSAWSAMSGKDRKKKN